MSFLDELEWGGILKLYLERNPRSFIAGDKEMYLMAISCADKVKLLSGFPGYSFRDGTP